MNLQVIADRVAVCERCGLCSTRTQTVPGDGAADAEIVLIGEAPGANEDEQGKPFVGRAGKLLSRLLKEVELSRRSVYITNLVKCRPPNNRNPEPAEIAACRRYLRRELKYLRPKVIVTLGRFSSQALLNTAMPIGQMIEARGWRYHKIDGRSVPVIPAWHPAYVLRTPSAESSLLKSLRRAARIARR